jgi:hypothetical protein
MSRFHNTGEAVPPNPPRNLTVVSVGTTNVTLSWLAPLPRRNADFEDLYIIRYANATGPREFFPPGGTLDNVTVATVPDLDSEFPYTFVVLARNDDGNSGASNNVSALTLPRTNLLYLLCFFFAMKSCLTDMQCAVMPNQR